MIRFKESDHSLEFLFEHDLIRKPVSIPGSSPGTGIFGIMLRPSALCGARTRSTCDDGDGATTPARIIGAGSRTVRSFAFAMPVASHRGIHHRFVHSGVVTTPRSMQ